MQRQPDNISTIPAAEATMAPSISATSPTLSVNATEMMQYSNPSAGYTIHYPKAYEAQWKVYQPSSPRECRILQLSHTYLILSVDKNQDKHCLMHDFDQLKKEGFQQRDMMMPLLMIENQQIPLNEVYTQNITADTSGKKTFTLFRQPTGSLPINQRFADANQKAYTYVEFGGTYDTYTEETFDKEYDLLRSIVDSITFQSTSCASSVLNLQVTDLPPGMTCEGMDDPEMVPNGFGILHLHGSTFDMTIERGSTPLDYAKDFCATASRPDFTCRLQPYKTAERFSLQGAYINDQLSALMGTVHLPDGKIASFYLYASRPPPAKVPFSTITSEDEKMIQIIFDHTVPINPAH